MPTSLNAIPKPRILITDSSVWVPKLYEIGEVHQHGQEGQMPRVKLLEQIKEADALFCLIRDRIDKEVLSNAKHLKVVATMSVGYEHIDVDECKKRGIKIGYTPGVLTEATAELCIALLLATSRRFPEAVRMVKSGSWGVWTPYFMCGKQLADSVVGIFGMGTIGRSIAEKLLSFHPQKIIYNNRNPLEDADQFGYVSFEKLLKESDFLVVAAAATEETKGIFNKGSFKKMKNDAIFINISRGSLVNVDDLVAALKTGEIGAAGLDVTDPEPLSISHPIHALENCLILPHIGSATLKTRNLMVSTTEDNIHNFLTNKPMVYPLY